MKCPKCTGTLGPFEHQGVCLDFCDTCGGTWFDEKELAKYFLLEKDLSSKSVLINPYDEKAPRCPKDASLMQEYVYMTGDSLKIDFCPVCYGIWLDRGEIPRMQTILSGVSRKFSELLLALPQIGPL
jgi:Zn-finger nucleic acid-binding protein